MAVQLDTSSSLDRTSRNIQVPAFNVLPSVSSKEKIFIVLQRNEGVNLCRRKDVMDGPDVASLFSSQECQIKCCKAKGTCC